MSESSESLKDRIRKLFRNCTKCGYPAPLVDGVVKCTRCKHASDAKQKEEDRWNALSADEKCNELRQLLLSLKRDVEWDGRIG